ncbi:MAG: addiction module protein [Bacteroidota bacterium]
MSKIKDILKLSVDKRINLVQMIWDSIAADAEASEISKGHKDILDKRLEAHQNNPQDVVSWDEVKKNAKKIL